MHQKLPSNGIASRSLFDYWTTSDPIVIITPVNIFHAHLFPVFFRIFLWKQKYWVKFDILLPILLKNPNFPVIKRKDLHINEDLFLRMESADFVLSSFSPPSSTKCNWLVEQQTMWGRTWKVAKGIGGAEWKKTKTQFSQMPSMEKLRRSGLCLCSYSRI